MNSFIKQNIKIGLVLLVAMLASKSTMAQETETSNQYNVESPFHNQLFFNRFLINPTFSLVRENKSYLNVLLRNQYASYEDNNQNYYLGFSNKLDKNTALGLGVYGRWSGIVQEFGFNANYATAVQLGEKSALAFGTNVNYLSQGLDKNRAITNESDPLIQEARKENKVTVEPGINLSLNKFDFGLYFRDLVVYNQTLNALETNFGMENITGTIQYSHTFEKATGLLANGRLMPMVQVGANGRGDVSYTGSVLLDLPQFGWFQSTYDSSYGFSSGIGVNLNKKLSLGYLMEKNLTEVGDNLGWNHELSLAYSFDDDLRGVGIDVNIAENKSEDARIDEVVKNYEEQILNLKRELTKGAPVLVDENSVAYENRLILDELILRQDSIEKARDEMFEKRFETMVRLIRHEIKQDYQEPKPKRQSRYANSRLAENNAQETKKNFRANYRTDLFEKTPIKSQNGSNIVGIASGYYMIANVFKNEKYLNSFMNNLKKKGLNARKFYNKENGLHYVYLADFKTKSDASDAYGNNLAGTYQEDKWIMEVYNPMGTATAELTFEE
ncbi:MULTISPECIES: PorP/SprF family type IX secretion system membrane protein [unclassified Croceitalea]|uniref:PorP/SprF family type IX secretion system membrane protein n=1 Tax=unclassified Croceitalea TaxID=2632280 RepID=UPI0030D80F15